MRQINVLNISFKHAVNSFGGMVLSCTTPLLLALTRYPYEAIVPSLYMAKIVFSIAKLSLSRSPSRSQQMISNGVLYAYLFSLITYPTFFVGGAWLRTHIGRLLVL